ncbi:asparagine synthase (glutamine-hydrolyzing) [Micromonospora sp. WMMA1363]|uniref:asparagine synthase (glutamine-hydrolyzing) n=1 Tax=Micromonospora sp. WMMA1363 TaxID=3053985 RepID=UPI00259CF313|nr:asparagine synthase (glutamine-hydrolyzing) [Micromonospora sp. WMMA1363]MDM4719586.1 asparagine synthase (glutamine-hydrolyzing) [Micromonospora sp. WMMA1363]
MCGIAGYIGISAIWGEPVLRRMADAQVHRGPDGDGYLAEGLIGLAHRRLVVIDRARGQQPMRSADGRYAMVYNGEVYNYRELRAELTGLGHRFTTASDTEVVLAAWTQWGRAAFDHFNGMFALAIADFERGEVVLARDQFGIKPLYLADDGDGRVFFASEIRPLLASDAIPRKPDDLTIYRYLRFRTHDDTTRTFFHGISRLMPGELALLSPDGRIQRSTYTNLYEDMDRLAATPKPYDRAGRQRFTAALNNAIKTRLVSDVPVGTALSGGLDSSTLVATIQRLLAAADRAAQPVGATQQTFSAVFPGESNNEEDYVDAVVAGCDALQVHKVRPDPDRFLVELRDFVRTQEEPVISTAPYAQYCVMREASRHVTVMLDGQGADEMLAGYLPYYLVNLRGLQPVRAAAELSRSLDVLWRLSRFRLADTVRRRRLAPADALLGRDFATAYRHERFPTVNNDIKARLAEDLFRHSLPALLRYEDRNTMRFSIEGRVPFLDTTLLRTVWSLDTSAIIHRGWNKRALRDATTDLLPRLVHRRRDKIGFTTPEDSWFRRIKNDVYLVFASQSFGARPYFDQPAVLRAFEDYVAGRGGAESMTFWRILNVELWLREFIDAPPAVRSDSGDRVTSLRAARPQDDDSHADLPGLHPQAPPKPDFVPNAQKELLLADGAWARFPLRTDLIATGDDVPTLAATRVGEFFKQVPEMPLPAQQLTNAGRWYLFVSEKVVAVAQGRIFKVDDIRSGVWARLLSRFVRHTPYGIGLGHPATMQLAIQEVGLPRILIASAVAAAGKAVGRRGLFYQVTGPAVRAIDGPTEYSAYPANISAKLAPTDPARVSRETTAAIRAVLPTEIAERFGGTVVIDANDFGQDVLGHDADLPEAVLARAFADNPLGQAREQTPFAVVVDQASRAPATSDRCRSGTPSRTR